MEIKDYLALQRKTLWRVDMFANPQRVDANHGYYHHNLGRNTQEESVIYQLTLEGHIIYKDADGTREVGPGEAILFSANEDTEYGRAPGWRENYVCEYVNLRGAGLMAHWNMLRMRHGSVVHLGLEHPLRHILKEVCKSAIHQHTPDGLASLAHRFVMDLFFHLENRHAQAQLPVERAVEELLRNPGAYSGLKQAAMKHGCSREHLARVFSQRVGIAPATFLTRAKVGRALELLKTTHMPLEQVSEQAGFGSQHTMARHIRETTGKPPSAVREEARDEIKVAAAE